MAVKPFPWDALPRVRRADVEAGRRLLAHLPLEPGPDWDAACAALGGPVELTLRSASALPGRAVLDEPPGATVRLSSGPGRDAWVVIDPALAPRLARRALGLAADELPAARPLTRAEEGALEFLVGALCDRGTVRTDGVAHGLELPTEAPVWMLDARVRTPVGEGWARLYAPESLRLTVPARPATLRSTRLERARFVLRVEAGQARLTRDELAGLGPGDVVLLDGKQVRLRMARGGLRAHFDGEALVIDDAFRWETSMGDESNDLLGELPIEVSCELGRVTLSGRELSELRPGAVVPVGRPLAGPVDLTVGGRVIASGELVDVEGELGVRITKVID